MEKIKEKFRQCEHKWIKGIVAVVVTIAGLHFGLPPEVAITTLAA